MCRLLCYMGKQVPMDMLVTKPEHSLVFQSRDASFHPGCPDKRNIRVNGDGFGIAWYTPRRIEEGGCVVKFPTPAWSSTNLLNIAKFVESGLVFAHVRAASDGAVLVGSVNHENTHPFQYKRYTFMHNGGIPGFGRIKRQLMALLGDEAYQAIEGTTDSEVCFAFFLDELPNTDVQLGAAEIAQVLSRTIARIVSAVTSFAAHQRPQATGRAADAPAGSPAAATAADVADLFLRNGAAVRAPVEGTDACAAEVPKVCTPPPSAAASSAANGGVGCGPAGGARDTDTAGGGGGGGGAAAPAMSLNFCVTDGRHIVCSRYRNHSRQDPPSLFVLSGDGFACDKEGSCLRLTAPEPHTSVVISSEPLCRSTKSWQLVPRNSMVIIEGTAPSTADASTSTADAGSAGMTVASGDSAGDDGASEACLQGGSPSGAADAAAGVDAATPPAARKEPLGLGLVSSITYEPLRCHASDAPAPGDPAFPDPACLPNSCARVPRSKTSGSAGGSGNGVGNGSMAYLAAKATVN